MWIWGGGWLADMGFHDFAGSTAVHTVGGWAALAGILVPLTLEKVGADPALASGTFVTTVTDVVGFFAFLGLAQMVLL